MRFRIKIVAASVLLLIVCSCKKKLTSHGTEAKLEFNGIVKSTHNIPVPGANVTILLSSGGRTDAGEATGTTDANGRFKIKGWYCNCFGLEASVHTKDSGFVEHQNIIDQKEFVLQLHR